MEKVCNTCKHIKRQSKSPVYFCEAFPGGIPMPFLAGDQEHTLPLSQQGNDIVWEPRD